MDRVGYHGEEISHLTGHKAARPANAGSYNLSSPVIINDGPYPYRHQQVFSGDD
jgi:hypothetical protein